jgi:hypothetical protein
MVIAFDLLRSFLEVCTGVLFMRSFLEVCIYFCTSAVVSFHPLSFCHQSKNDTAYIMISLERSQYLDLLPTITIRTFL